MAPFGCLLIVQVLLSEFLFLYFAMADDVSEVTWAHAVNSRHMLETELAGPVDFLEADVSMGHVIGQEFGPPIPIMSHPPNTTSDLSLDTWLDIVIARRTGKGVKLDFKSIETLKPSMKLLESHAQKLNFSLWLNADILSGPINSTTPPLPPDVFLSLCHQYFPNAVLSLGWTTYWFSTFPPDTWHYEWIHVRKMADTIRCAFDSRYPSITFPVRGIFASRSIEQLQWLLGVIPGSTLTVWNSKFDALEFQDLVKIRSSFPKNAVYYDVPNTVGEMFREKKDNISPLDEIKSPTDHQWITLTHGQSDSCSSFTYMINNTIVFGRSLTTAVLLKNLIFLNNDNNLKVKGRVVFFKDKDQVITAAESTHSLAIVLVDVNLFSKETSSSEQERLDLTQSDTDVLWSAFNASEVHKFNYEFSGEGSACKLFNLDTTKSRSFDAWSIPCDILHDGVSFKELADAGISEVSSRRRLVLPQGPFMFGFISTGDGYVAIYDLEITGRKEDLSTVSSSYINISSTLFISFLLSCVLSYIFLCQ